MQSRVSMIGRWQHADDRRIVAARSAKQGDGCCGNAPCFATDAQDVFAASHL